MAANTKPVNAWDAAVLVVSESTLGTVPAPAASQALEFITCDTGMAEVGDTRGKKDRNPGRGMQNEFVEGRVKPMAFTVETSCKSRAANTTVPKESAVMKAAGLLETVGGASVAYTTPADPIGSAAFSPLSLYRVFGKSPYVYEAEQMRGGVVKTLSWTGGDKELTLKASGAGIGKYWLGYVDSVTMLIGATTLTVTGDDIYRISPGYYQCESEVILVTSGNYSTGVFQITRAQVATAAAGHTAVPWRPYVPALTYLGSPISEGGTVTVTVDSVVLRAMAFHVDLTTGMDHLPGESGSKYTQGVKSIRYDWKAGAKLVLHSDDVAMLGKATQRKAVAVSFVQGGTAGGIYTFSLPTCEIEPFKVPDTANDVAIVDVSFRVRDSSAGNDAGSIVLS